MHQFILLLDDILELSDLADISSLKVRDLLLYDPKMFFSTIDLFFFDFSFNSLHPTLEISP